MRHNYPIQVFKLPHSDPKTQQEVLENRKPPEIPFGQMARGQSIDSVLRKARDILEAKGWKIRSVSMGTGKIVAYVSDPPSGPYQPRKPLSEKRVQYSRKA